MKALAAILVLIFASPAFGQVVYPLVVPNPFVNGTVADADEVNANFDAVEAAVNDLDARVGTGSAVTLVAGEDLDAGEAVRVSSGDNGETAGKVYLAADVGIAGSLVADDFDRANNLAVGNSFTETESNTSNFQILSNHLLMRGSAGAANNTVLHHAIAQNNALEMRFSMQWDDGTGGNHRVSYVTGSTAAFDTGYGVRFHRDSSTHVTLSVVDGAAIVTAASVPMPDAIWHEVEIRIFDDFSVEARFWTDARPAAATLSSGAIAPTSAGGAKFAIHRTQGGGNSRNVNIDDLVISTLTNHSSVLGVAGAAAATDAAVPVVFSGPLTSFAGLAPGARYFLGTTAGTITTKGADASTPRVGFAVSATTLLVMP